MCQGHPLSMGQALQPQLPALLSPLLLSCHQRTQLDISAGAQDEPCVPQGSRGLCRHVAARWVMKVARQWGWSFAGRLRATSSALHTLTPRAAAGPHPQFPQLLPLQGSSSRAMLQGSPTAVPGVNEPRFMPSPKKEHLRSSLPCDGAPHPYGRISVPIEGSPPARQQLKQQEQHFPRAFSLLRLQGLIAASPAICWLDKEVEVCFMLPWGWNSIAHVSKCGHCRAHGQHVDVGCSGVTAPLLPAEPWG